MSEFSEPKPSQEAHQLPQELEARHRLEQGRKLISFLKRIDAYDYVRDIVAGNEEKPSFEKFKKFLFQINGILRSMPVTQRKADGERVYLSGGLGDEAVPKHADKEGLLKYAYDSIPDIERNDVKYLLPAMVNAVHLFADGNGRTSRILYQLLTDSSSEEDFLEQAEKAVQGGGRWETLDVNPGIVTREIERPLLEQYGWNFDKESGWDIDGIPLRFRSGEVQQLVEHNASLPPEAKEFFILDERNRLYALSAIYTLMGKDAINEICSSEDERKYAISPRKMAEVLSKSQWQQLVDSFYQLKREEVKNLVEIFKEPQRYKTKEENRPVKDYFISEVNKKHQYYNT